ncbi:MULTISPECIES: SMP-30/gluconolactonase/LRE family protein [unclassified Microbacterium]|uniref:SMP-30/gluconolactonase/LRE family protein n=1 Tax=unclassified Microbacterium TaxID=2609290 RepID=UPI000C2C7C26|nr:MULTISPECIES: SMP-30/gluconolactonase/LRE family protein [unclassified Microbacterium]
MRTIRTIVRGLNFPESPRWHDGMLWFSDIYGKTLFTCRDDGHLTEVLHVEGLPSGLGFDPQGRALIASMRDGVLIRNTTEGPETVADLSALAAGSAANFGGFMLNDMVVDPDGRAYIGVYGVGPNQDSTGIVLVEPGGDAQLVADGLAYVNGMVITPDRSTLIAAELDGEKITAYDLAADGTLSGARIWASLPGTTPDGICLDAEGMIWTGSVYTNEFLRVREGGEIVERLPVGKFAMAPMLGGAAGTTLYLATADTTKEEMLAGKSSGGLIEVTEVDVPGAGWP